MRPPTPAEEAARDLCRAREDAKQDRMRGRHRLSKFLLRRGVSYMFTPPRAAELLHRGAEGLQMRLREEKETDG